MGKYLARNPLIAVLIGSLAAIAIFLSANLLVRQEWTDKQIDLTERDLFTLSEGSRSVIAGLTEPITLRYYSSEALGREIPSYGIYATRVRDMLRRFEELSNGKIELRIINPEPFSEAEDRAVALGLQGVPVNRSGDTVYFGIAGTNSVDDLSVIPFLQPERERFLEYDLAKMVYELSTTERSTVGILSGIPVEGGTDRPLQPGAQPRQLPVWEIVKQLRTFFKTETISPADGVISEDIDVLLVIHPKEFRDKTLYAIDQFVMRGGQLVVFVDPNAEYDVYDVPDPTYLPEEREFASTLEPLLGSWGIVFEKDTVVGDLARARRVRAPGKIQAVNFVGWPQLTPDEMNRDDVVTGDLTRVNLGSAGAISVADGAGVTLTPLITTTEQSGTLSAALFRPRPDVVRILNTFQPDGEERVLAGRVTGPVKTAYPDGPPEAVTTSGEDVPEQIMEGREPANIIVIADTDMLDDRFWVSQQSFFGQTVATPFAQNAEFVINAVEAMTGSDALISLRSRGAVARPFEVIDQMERAAEKQFRETEAALQKELEETEKRLSEVRSQDTGAADLALSGEQTKLIEGLREKALATRKELRAVQRALRDDIESLETSIRFANIGAVPILVGVLALLLTLVRRRRRRRAVRTA